MLATEAKQASMHIAICADWYLNVTRTRLYLGEKLRFASLSRHGLTHSFHYSRDVSPQAFAPCIGARSRAPCIELERVLLRTFRSLWSRGGSA